VRRFAALLALLLAAPACSTTGSPDRFVSVSGQLPPIAGTTLDGTPIGPEAMRGKVVLVNFWNPDCPPCRDEMATLETAWDRYRDTGLEVLGIMYVGGGWPDDPAAARSFLERQGVTYPTIVDRTSAWARQLDVAGIPTTVVVDRRGDVRYRLLGRFATGDADRVMAELGGATGSG
jgi:peroxiredoxin